MKNTLELLKELQARQEKHLENMKNSIKRIDNIRHEMYITSKVKTAFNNKVYEILAHYNTI